MNPRISTSAGWAMGVIPIRGEGFALLEKQATVMAPLRAAEGQILLADMPYDRDPGGAINAVAAALEIGQFAFLHEATLLAESDDTRVGKKLASCLEQLGIPAERSEADFELRLETGAFQQKIAARPCGSQILLRGILARWREAEPVTRAALAHFLLSLNRRTRLARGSIAGNSAVVEAVLPVAALEPWLLQRALDASLVAARLARRECAALIDSDIARQYAQFHITKEEHQ